MLLNTHTYYSLRYGILSVDQLLQLGAMNGHGIIALTDINSTSACVDFIRLASKHKVKPVLGVDFRVGIEQKHVLLAQNNIGFQQINTYLTAFLVAKTTEERVVLFEASDLSQCFIIYPFSIENSRRALKGNEFVGVSIHDLPQLALKKIPTHKMVVLQTVTFTNNRSHNIHKLLRAIDLNVLLSMLQPEAVAKRSEAMIGLDTLLTQFEEYPEMIANTQFILHQCHVHFNISPHAENENLSVFQTDQESDFDLLRKLAYAGIKKRYQEVTDVLLDRIEMELKMIQAKSFVSYFLINWDIITYANQQGYFHVGRGSGANSLVAYLLGITDVDPLELNLYFERFINLYRTSPPDFDLDFSWQDREDVTRYIFEKYPNAALVCTYNTFQYKGLVRELGKVFGLPVSDIEKLSRGHFVVDQLDSVSKQIIRYAHYMQNFPSYLSVHAGGIIIADKPIAYFCATFLPPKGYPTLQFDMVVSEDVGLYKYDILSQRGLGKIKDAIQIVKENKGIDVFHTVHDILYLKQDKRVNDYIKKAEAIGCFYVESPAMRMLLKKLQVDNYLALVAASSVIRPGVAKSGMMKTYIERFRFPERRKDAPPIMLSIMPETYGVMVYQEDVLKVAHLFGGLDLGEADVLRRGMAGKFRSRETFQDVKNKFFSNAIAKGHSQAMVTEIWRQIESFAGYAFAKGHSASYAVESYQSLYLKSYYPLEYMVATVNNGGGFYSTELYFLEAQKWGATIHPPCVNTSKNKTIIIGKDIYIGFGFLHGFETKSAKRILIERSENGIFTSLSNFIKRVNMSLEQLIVLIRINAFRFTGVNKRELLWEVHLYKNKLTGVKTKSLFDVPNKSYQFPALDRSWKADAFDQLELLGFSLYSFFQLLENPDTNELLAKDLKVYENKVVWLKGYLVTVKTTGTASGKKMLFGTFLDKTLGWIDTVHFPLVAEKYPIRGKGVYAIKGTVKIDFDCVSIEVMLIKKLPVIDDPRYAESKGGNNKPVVPKQASA